jgi:hypothetical protein
MTVRKDHDITKTRAYQDGQAMGKAILRASELFYQRKTRKNYLCGVIVPLQVGIYETWKNPKGD